MIKLRERKLLKARSKFEYWVYHFGGIQVTADAIGVTDNTVRNWLFRKTQPSLVSILRILKLAPELTLKDIAKGTLP